MNNYISKIDKELLTSVKSLGVSCCNCIVYTEDFLNFKNSILNKKLKTITEYYEFPFIKAFGLKLNDRQILSIAKYDNVRYISKQSTVFAQVNTSKKIMQMDEFYKRDITGKNCTIAIIDTGITPHVDFYVPNNRLIKFIDLIHNKKVPYDDNGHGTFVAGIACGNGVTSGGKFAGLAKGANLISIKALEGSGEAGAFKILEAMQWVYDNRRKYNIRVVCMSFGSNPIGSKDPLNVGAEVLWNAGIVVVAAAGNSGPAQSTIKSPGAASRIITVGGMDDKRSEDGSFAQNKFEVAEFSSRGPAGYYYKPDLIAPSCNIMGLSNAGGYVSLSGTSVATPMIAGIACLIIQKNPEITPDQVKLRIVKSCEQISGLKNDEGFGWFRAGKFFQV